MNITEEAARRYIQTQDSGTEAAIGCHLGFIAGANWARKETLREAGDILHKRQAIASDGMSASYWSGIRDSLDLVNAMTKVVAA